MSKLSLSLVTFAVLAYGLTYGVLPLFDRIAEVMK